MKTSTLLVIAIAIAAQINPAFASKSNHQKQHDANSSAVPREFARGNFFSDSAAAAVVPSVDKRPGPGDDIGKMLIDPNPTLEQMRLIPSLEEAQRKELNEFFNIYRSDLKAVREQLSEQRKEFKATLATKMASGVAPDPMPKEENDPAISLLIDQIKIRQEHFTEVLKRIVRPAQMEELEQLKRGKVPAYAE